MTTLSTIEARQLFLSAQQLLAAPKMTNLQLIQHLGHIQIDTISVVERAHHHILWTRHPAYQVQQLDLLQKEKKIFEYWSHAASYLPMDHYPFYLRRMRQYQEGKNHWFKADKKLIKNVLDRIRIDGPLKSSDFEYKKKSSGWFDWKPQKKALEQLFMAGILMVKERQGFQKVYDLTERVLPSEISTTAPDDRTWVHFFMYQRLQSLGIATIDEIAYQRGPKIKKLLQSHVSELLAQGQLLAASIEKQKATYYVLPNFAEMLSVAVPKASSLQILSPFDNSVIQRKKLNQLFQFDYQIECYTPEAKRRFGYFCLPLLCGLDFVGRVDLKADRANKTLVLNNIFWEDEKKKKVGEKYFSQALTQFAHFNGCQNVKG